MSCKKFFYTFLCLGLFCLAAMGMFIYVWDPCNYYRIVNNELKYVASAYIDAGVIRNADYDTAIIGSSLSQNFQPELFRQELGENVVKVNTGGISLEQRDLFYNCIEQNAKAEKYYVEIMVSSFNAEDDILDDTPVYMYDQTVLNDYKYLYGYETWLRAVPISLAYKFLDICGIEITTMHNLRSVDNVGDWHNRYALGEDVVKQKYLSGVDAVAAQNLEGMRERMIANVDRKLTTIIDADNTYVFYFPPYSALFWYSGEKQGYMDTYLEVKNYIISKLADYSNVEVYDFQQVDYIMDLNNYRDATHYSKDINDWMTKCFASGEYCVKEEDCSVNTELFKRMTVEFGEKNKEWLE